MPDPDLERERRKHEHIEAVRVLAEPGGTGLEDIFLLPQSASELDVDEVSLETTFLGQTLRSPVIINAMTGGTEEARRINRRLALLARRHGLAMAVGSETAALHDAQRAASYTVTREVNPDGVLIANVGMGASPQRAQRAVDLIGANLLQIHWNTAQELFMAEGERRFRGMLAGLEQVTRFVSVPVIAKEVGQGMIADAARRFAECGVRGIDIGGMGGTNFIAVEAWRRGMPLDPEWQRWGVPTACSLGEVLALAIPRLEVVASGGIRSGHDVAKCIAMGARAVGVAGPLMRLAAHDESDRQLDQWLEDVHWTLKAILVLTAAPRLEDLRQRPLVIAGRVGEWLSLRGCRRFVERLARRGQGDPAEQ